MNEKTKEKLEKTKKVIYINEIDYLGKKYVKTMKMQKNGIEYIYYEIENEEIKEIQDKAVVAYFKERFEIKDTNIIY